jgi:6-phosphogluconolactonase
MKYTPLAFAVMALAACSTDRTTGLDESPETPSFSRDSRDGGRGDEDDSDERDEQSSGMVYVLSNQTSGNAVLAYRRRANGALSAAEAFTTGGTGTGGGLGSQNALVLNAERDLLFVVNAGSNTVSSFRENNGNLRLVSTISSGGLRPISLTASRGLLYVLNAGGSGNIAGLRYSARGQLSAIPNSSRTLSSAASAPAQIEFTPDGNQLIVTEKATNQIGSYTVAQNGLASAATFTPSSGQTPFGFAFRRDILIVSEAFGGAPGASAASSYRVSKGRSPSLVSGTVPTTETAACWFVVTKNGRFAYTTNTASGTITGYAVSREGALARLVENGESAVLGAGSAPTDLALSRNSRYLYTLNSGTGTIAVARVGARGALTVLGGGIAGLPAGSVGIVAQ